MTGPPDDVAALHAQLTGKARALYPMVELDDIKQELWAAYYASEHRLDGAESAADGLTPEGEREDTRPAIRALRREMWNAVERYCRREKAEAAGYRTTDEAFYSSGALRALLEAWFAEGVKADPPKTRENSVKRRTTPGEGGDYLISMVDVDYAIRRLDTQQQVMLFFAYSPEYAGKTDEEIAADLRMRGMKHMTEHVFRKKVWRAVRALQRQLGGASPW